MPCCYIIFSEKLNRFYIGATQDDPKNRIAKHNNHTYGKHKYTAKASDWKLFIAIEAEDYPHATRIERFIKKQKSAVYIRNLIKYPELVQKIKIRTQ